MALIICIMWKHNILSKVVVVNDGEVRACIRELTVTFVRHHRSKAIIQNHCFIEQQNSPCPPTGSV